MLIISFESPFRGHNIYLNINIGSGTEVSVLELIKSLKRKIIVLYLTKLNLKEEVMCKVDCR